MAICFGSPRKQIHLVSPTTLSLNDLGQISSWDLGMHYMVQRWDGTWMGLESTGYANSMVGLDPRGRCSNAQKIGLRCCTFSFVWEAQGFRQWHSCRARESWPANPGLPPSHAGCLFLFDPQHQENVKNVKSSQNTMLRTGARSMGLCKVESHFPISQHRRQREGGFSRASLVDLLWLRADPALLLIAMPAQFGGIYDQAVQRVIWVTTWLGPGQEVKAECFILQTADFLFNSPSLKT